MEVIFARTRYHYDSYSDFWKLVELAEFDTCYVDEIDIEKEATYITTPINGEIRPHVSHRRSIAKTPQACKIVWWNLERPDERLHEVITELLQYIDRVWVSDRHYKALDARLEHVVLGSDPKLRLQSGQCPRNYDWTHQSYTSPRRNPIYSRLRRMKLREGPNGWNAERDLVLRSSHLMLNVHQDDQNIGEPLRFAVAAAYSMPMISETMVDPWPLRPNVDYANEPYDRLVAAVAERRTQELRHLGTALHQTLCVERTFRTCVEEAV